jgi:hypothetical protein
MVMAILRLWRLMKTTVDVAASVAPWGEVSVVHIIEATVLIMNICLT